MLSFLHCADIHLGHLQHNEPQRLLDFAEAFRQAVDYALRSKVDFMLISGDFFHKRAINAQVLEQAIELLTPLKEAGIPVVAVEGNHDKAFYQDNTSWLGFLNNRGYLCLLTSSFEEGRLVLSPWDEAGRTGSWLDLPGVRIYGLGYLGVTTAARLAEAFAYLENKEADTYAKDRETEVYPEIKEETAVHQEKKAEADVYPGDSPQVPTEQRYTILMLHAAVNRLLGQDLGGVRREALAPFQDKIDYVALGHIHSRYEIEDWVFNPGSLECVHLDEHGPGLEKGFYHVLLDGSSKKVKHIASRRRPAVFCTADLSGTLEPGEAAERICRELQRQDVPDGAQLRIILTGDAPYSALSLDIETLIQRIKEEFGCLYVEIINRLNLPTEERHLYDGAVKREDIERLVFSRILAENRAWEDRELESVVNVVRNTKEMALRGDSEQEIIDYLLSYIEETSEASPDLPGEEGPLA